MRRRILLALLGCVPWATTARAEPPRAAVVANERGLAHLGARPARLGPAVDAFREARRTLPADQTVARNLAAALALQARRQLDSRRPEEAATLLREARELHPERIRYRVMLAEAWIQLGSEVGRLDARDELAAVLELDPDHLVALVQLAGIDYQERRLEEGNRRLEHAKRLRPGDDRIKARQATMERELRVERLYHSLEGSVFIVRHAPTIPLQRAQTILSQCERAWTELCGRFDHYPTDRIVVTLYPPDDFRDATNLHAWVAGVSDGTIRLTVRTSTTAASIERTLRHELAHHILRDLAPRTPVWLHEGLAQLAEGRDGAQATRNFARRSAPAVTELDRSILRERDARRVARYYELALAFTHALQQLQGDRGMQAFLGQLRDGKSEGEAIRAAFGRTRAELFDAWKATIPRR